MKGLAQVGCVVLLAGAVVLAENRKPASSDAAARAAAVRLFQGLTAEQKALALKDFNDKDRHAEIFPAVERKGLSFDRLTAEQKALVDQAIDGMTSEYGASRCKAVAKQTGPNRIYLNFFGAPEAGQPFAWRIATHHLTLLYSEFGKEPGKEFGPVLLGGNPVNKLWDEEEKLLLELRAALSEEEAGKVVVKGGGGSGAAVGNAGLKIGDLGEKPRALARKLLEQRLAVFSADRRKLLEELIRGDGGVEALRLAVYGNAGKGHLEGGTYSWKIGGPSVLCDWQTVGKNHIHMTVRARAKS
jgi:hypothetical protein